jgi:hypothetical protein
MIYRWVIRIKRCVGLAFSFARLRLHSNMKKITLSNDFESTFQKPDWMDSSPVFACPSAGTS